ncbi:MAG: hypothetical protein JJ869_20065 [Marivita sp.]|uniref:hypothetical protein n=1 Tax=Marivita sp. TaxID=2003365 RepID=UPI001B182E17|nr:hypothetical protein [Marivita sp.]MBO6885850.1 hypothetical protein [Marivita sp.]
MAMRGKKQAVDDGAMRALLKQYACPFPYHQVRARLMGNIATPDMNASPMKEVQRLWNDDLPVFDSQKEAEAFFAAILQGLWNGLSAHQKRSDPFKLVRLKTAPASYEYLARLGRVRREEIDGFVDGLFAGHEEMDFPESAHKPVGILGELRALFAATEEMALNPPGPADVSTLEQTVKHLRELTRIAEGEINTIIQSCRKARQQMLETYVMERPGTLH